MTTESLRILSEYWWEALNSTFPVKEILAEWQKPAPRTASVNEVMRKGWAFQVNNSMKVWNCRPVPWKARALNAPESCGKGGQGSGASPFSFTLALPPAFYTVESNWALKQGSEAVLCFWILQWWISFLRDWAVSYRCLSARLLFCLAFSYLFTHLRSFTTSKDSWMQEPCPKCPFLSCSRA